MRIFVIFDAQNAKDFLPMIQKEDYVVSPAELLIAVDCNLVQPNLTQEEEEIIADDVRQLFEKLENSGSFSGVKGFANNFYECTIAPIASYTHVLNTLILTLKQQHEDIEVWFPTKHFLNLRRSAYYMAEHESQGVRLYSRESMFSPYLVSLCNKHQVRINYVKTCLGLKQGLMSEARILTVYTIRFIKSLYDSIKHRTDYVKQAPMQAEIIATSRSVMQSNLLIPFLKKSRTSMFVAVSETFLSAGRNHNLWRSTSQDGAPIQYELLRSTVRDICVRYKQIFTSLILKPNIRYDLVNGIKLKISYALAEVLVMWPDLVNYRDSLHQLVGLQPMPHSKLLLSTEQKSPYAYADAWVARQCGLLCAHAMQCDQASRPLPYPIYGDFFLVDCKVNLLQFTSSWKKHRQNVRYIGSFKACVEDPLPQKSITTAWCYFSQCSSIDLNREILKVLRLIKDSLKIQVYVKLHPRDQLAHYKEYNDFVFLDEKKYRRAELFSKFTYAITFPSGVVTDLLYNNKPFLIGRFLEPIHLKIPYIDETYVGNFFGVNDLIDKMRDLVTLEQGFEAYRNRFITNNEIISDADYIRNALFKLQYERDESMNLLEGSYI